MGNKKRDFEFSEGTLRDSRLRQKTVCAHCGGKLKNVWEEGHHVIPDQAGDKANPGHTFLNTADNCVILCTTCHTNFVHDDGRCKFGAIPFPKDYHWSHGDKDCTEHQLWVGRMDDHAKAIWPNAKVNAKS